MKTLLTTAEVAQWLGIDSRTLYRLCRLNRIPYIRVGPKSLRFEEDAVKNWLMKHQKGYWSA